MSWTKKISEWLKGPAGADRVSSPVARPAYVDSYLEGLAGPDEMHGLGGDCQSPYCNYEFTPEDEATSGGGGSLTCPLCGFENDLKELHKPMGQPGGTTRSGLSLKEMGDIGESIVLRLGELPGIGAITSAGGDYNHPIDAIVEAPQGKFGCEIKSVHSQAQERFKLGGRQERLQKLQFCYENGLKPAIIGVRLNFFTSLAYVFFREGMTDTWIGQDKMMHVGTFNFEDLNPFRSPDPQAQALAVENAHLPDQSEDEFAGVFPPLHSGWHHLAAMIDILDQKVAEIATSGGFTIRRTPGRYIVSFADSEQRVPERQASGKVVALYIRKHLAPLLEFPDAGVGGWLSQGMMVLDLSRAVDDFGEASAFGIQNSQEAIYDSETGQYYFYDPATGAYILDKKQSKQKKSSFDYSKFPKMLSNVTIVEPDFFQKCADELEQTEQEGDDEPALVMAAFNEEDHPRDHGRFTFKQDVKELKVVDKSGKHSHNVRRCVHCGHLNAYSTDRPRGREQCSTCGEDPDRDLKLSKIVLATREADQVAQSLGFQFFGRTGQGHRKYSMQDENGTDHTIVVGSGAHGKNAAQIDADRARQRMTRCINGQCHHITTPTLPAVVEGDPFVVRAGQTVSVDGASKFVQEVDGGLALVYDVQTGAEDVLPVAQLQAVGGWLQNPRRGPSEPFSRHSTPEGDPDYLFIFYMGELRTEPYHHNRSTKDIFEDLLSEFGMDLQGSWNDISQSDIDVGKIWADGKIEHENLTNPDVKEQAEDALRDWWDEEKDNDWTPKPEEAWQTL